MSDAGQIEPTTAATRDPTPAPPPPVEGGVLRLTLPFRPPVDSAAALLEPDLEEQKHATAVVREMFSAEYAGRRPEERSALARKLTQRAREVPEDAVLRFALLREACTVASSAGDVETAFVAIEQLGALYVVDVLELTLTALTLALGSVRTPERAEAFAWAYLEIADRAAERGWLDVAAKAADFAQIHARRSKSVTVVSRTTARVASLAPAGGRTAKTSAWRAAIPEDRQNTTAVRAFFAHKEGTPLPGGGRADLLEATVHDAPRAPAPPVPAPVLRPGTVVSGFELVEPLGQGGMGEVWKARQKSLGRMVAIKFLAASLASRPEILARFQLEARSAASLDHPGIVRVLDHGEHGTSAYMVLELVDGPTLEARLKERGALPEPEALAIARALAEALGAIHARGLVHRDVKPDNVLLTRDGAPKLGDLGLVRCLEQDEKLTQTGVVVGTPRYMAPEQALAVPDPDGRMDLYSLGLVLYRCLSGRHPFEAATTLAQLTQRLQQDVPPVRDVAPHVSPGAAAIVKRLTERDRAARYATAADVVRDIDSLQAKPPGSGTVAGPAWWSRLASGLAIAAVAATVAALAASARGQTPASTEARTPASSPGDPGPAAAEAARQGRLVAAVQSASASALRAPDAALALLRDSERDATPSDRAALDRAAQLVRAAARSQRPATQGEYPARLELEAIANTPASGPVEESARDEALGWARLMDLVAASLAAVSGRASAPATAPDLPGKGARSAFGAGWIEGSRQLTRAVAAFERGSFEEAADGARRCPDALEGLSWYAPSVAALRRASAAPGSGRDRLESVAAAGDDAARSPFVLGHLASAAPR